MFQIVLLVFRNEPLMKAAIQQALDARINIRLKRTLQKLVEFAAVGRAEPAAQRFESTAIILRRKHLSADQRRKHHSEQRMSPSPLPCQVGFGKSSKVPRQHFVANTEYNCGIVAVRFHVSGKAAGAKIARKQTVVRAVGTAREFLTRDILRDFKRQCAVCPQLPNRAPDCFLHPQSGRMIVSAMNYRDTRMTTHEQLENPLSIGSDTCTSQCLFDNGGDDRDRLRSADQSILVFTGVHSHEFFGRNRVRLLYQEVQRGSTEDPDGNLYSARFQSRFAIKRSFLCSIGES